MNIPEFRAEVLSRNGSATVVVEGEVDAHTGPMLWTTLEDAITTTHGPVVLDVGGVSFIDSRGLSILAQAVRRLGDRPLVLRSPTRTTKKILEISGLVKLVELET